MGIKEDASANQKKVQSDLAGATVAGEQDANLAENSLLNKLLRSELVNCTSDLEVLRQDPSSPLYSVKSFDALNLKPEILKGVYLMGFNAPSKIQETALPSLLAEPPQNMIAQSQSGTGKTAAFVLTMLSRVNTSLNHPQCLCVVPTFELALQIGHVVEQMSKCMTSLRIMYSVKGGHSVSRGQLIDAHIVIGTPGTTLDWSTKLKVFDLKKIRVFVLDEADIMMDIQGLRDQSIRLQRRLSKDNCQMLLFSATYNSPIMQFAQAVVPNPLVIRLKREEESLHNIKQYFIRCANLQEKFHALSNIYGAISIGQSMIFCHTRNTANWLAERMVKQGHAVGILHGELSVGERAVAIQRFRSAKEKVLITTNVSARGIDVAQVTIVVNFDLPVNKKGEAGCETYLHRIGRTGRFGNRGLAINMVDGPRSLATLQSIESHFGRCIQELDPNDIDQVEALEE
ncbi:hypothetical protein CAPTEDRAFT_19802 [Capitella teleta]|uniref:RNA helicase n=1 Tax=Capitella teleta TaxID=283909 RepID=R7V0X4_CAPTE|nr:hypothetical protein CAPTEDRAFT_19802 [Capitella teleta]|eukprot:ELU09872.1 hypothetical protein CAPTEDRAFT_19802 [Capitella teleta]